MTQCHGDGIVAGSVGCPAIDDVHDGVSQVAFKGSKESDEKGAIDSLRAARPGIYESLGKFSLFPSRLPLENFPDAQPEL
jgi:hypothetical protein